MKFKKVSFVFLFAICMNIFAMYDGSDGRITPPKRLKRSDFDATQYLGQFATLKSSFRDSVSNNDLDAAKDALNTIDDIYNMPSLIFVNPLIRKKICNFLGSDEVRRFNNIYKIAIDKKLKELLLDSRVLISDLVGIVKSYVLE